jgi:integrase
MAVLKEGYAARMSVPTGKSKTGKSNREAIAMDDTLPGFGIRMTASGKAAYFVKFQIGSQQRKITLGNALAPGRFADTRKVAAKILADAKLGVDVRHEIEARRAKTRAPKSVTINELLLPYLEMRAKKLRASSADGDRRYLRVLQGAIGTKAPAEVTRADIAGVLDQVQHFDGGDRSVSADRARAAASTFFAWLIERGHLDANPASGLKKRAASGSRERVLTPEELRNAWNALPDGEYGVIVRLLMLSGQRRNEIGGLHWSEVHDLDVPGRARIELPPERVKNKAGHTVALSPEAVAILKTVPRREGRDLVFGRGKGGFAGWSKCKLDLDKRLPKGMPNWTIHDLRRSFSTHAAELDLAAPNVIEQALNHQSGSRAGVASVYNKARLTEQTRRLMDAWAIRLRRLLDGKDWSRPADADNVEILRSA